MKKKFYTIYQINELKKNQNKLGDLVRTADKRNIFSKSDTTNWSNKLYTITEIIDDTIPR